VVQGSRHLTLNPEIAGSNPGVANKFYLSDLFSQFIQLKLICSIFAARSRVVETSSIALVKDLHVFGDQIWIARYFPLPTSHLSHPHLLPLPATFSVTTYPNWGCHSLTGSRWLGAVETLVGYYYKKLIILLHKDKPNLT